LIAQIRRALTPLVGLPLWAANRAADIVTLQFGEGRPVPMDRTPDRIVGGYALHLSCAWRLSGTTGVIVGASDKFVPATDDEEDFRWDRPGRALGDVLLKGWIASHSGAPLCVESVDVDRCGGFVLRFPQTFALEVFPDAGSAPHDIREQWRLLQPGTVAPHFVYLNQGIE
jgi:hypothetical protein